jgi:hypothetical protein
MKTMSNATWLHVYVTLAAITLAVVTTYYPQSIEIILKVIL